MEIKVCTIVDFTDKKENTERKIGDYFNVSPERFIEITEKGGNWIVPVADISEILSKYKEDINNKSNKESSDKESSDKKKQKTKKSEKNGG
ncbi:hypothetical protein [Peptostreptococcus porci]|uniref:hypothetical protein n=1 Tax=Peptostreptococcus porci TaxID=2652282 RepID=UPI002A80A445|nr:hypothetical protein [Peptostreptococcus porci]MDY4128693.1 hypothetical protein [Peptostreptococcus porci]